MFPWKKLARLGLNLALMAFLGVSFGCGGKSDGTPAPVAVAPSITTQPLAATVLSGQPASFTVTAAGTAPLTYQWRKDGATLPGATLATYTIASAQTADAGTYSVVVTNPAGSVTSGAAALTVQVPVTITTPPVAQAVTAGQAVSFSVVAAGTGPYTYQWQKDGADLPGATSATLALTNVQVANAGAYRVIVTGAAGPVTSAAAVLTVNPLIVAPTITTQPKAQVVTAPDAPTFSVVATGGNLTYQWKKGGTALAGATAASYTVPGFTDLQTLPDSYTVVVSNGTSVESASATYSVVAPSPYYLPGGEPVAQPSRPLTVLPSLHVDAVKFPKGSFRLGYDEALKNPAWTAYGDFKVNTPYANSTGDYQTDTRLAAPQVAPADMGTHGGATFYLSNGQGFDRGHMVTRSDVSYRYGTAAGDDATYMSDMIPQVSYYNQRLWNDLEEAVGGKFSGSTFTNGLTATFGRVWIYSGPVFTGTTSYWVPSTETYTTSKAGLPAGTLAIAIPTATYRIMVAEPAQGQTLPRVMAWLSSNRSYTTGETADLWKYVTSVKRVEDLTGLDFFPGLTHDTALSAWKASVDVRGWGTDFDKAAGPNVHIVRPSWDLVPIQGNPILKGDTLNVGDTLALEAAVSPNRAGGVVDAATGCTWTFGDGTPSGTGLSTSHVYSVGGSYTLTFTAKDSLNQTSSITRTITVVAPTANTPPAFTPATLPNVIATAGMAIPALTFSLSDDRTAPGSILVTAVSDNQALLPSSGLLPVNTNGAVTMALNPVPGQAGLATITVTATDGDGSPTVKTFTLTLNANNPPTFTPSTLADLNSTMNATKQVTFSLADDHTAAASLVVKATSNNQTLLPDGNIGVVNSGGNVTLTLTQATGQVGAALVTVVATDGDGASTTRTFTLTVSAGAMGPVLIISQYYEGTSNNKWLEVTNVGDAVYDAAAKAVYVCQWNNPRTSNAHKSLLISGTLGIGESVLLRNGSAVLPAYAYNGGGTTSADGVRVINDSAGVVINFNGNDVVYLSDRAPASTTDTAAYDNRLDAIGDYLGAADTTPSNWDPTVIPTLPPFPAGTAVAADRSFVRLATVTTPKKVFDPAQWVQVDAAQITTTTPSAVDTAATGTTNRLGLHVYNH